MPGGIESSRVRDKSISSLRESLSSTGIGDGEKDSIAASEFSEINSFEGRGDELSYNNFSIRRIYSSGSQSTSSVPGGIDLRRMKKKSSSASKRRFEKVVKSSQAGTLHSCSSSDSLGFGTRCGSPVDGLYCRHCALLRKKLKEVWFTISDEHEFFQDFLNTSASSNDDPNVVNMPQEPIVFNQDPGENSLQSPLQIDHHCCYGCGNSLDGIFYQQCTYKFCGKEFPQTLPSSHPTCYSGDKNSFAYDSTPNLVKDSPNIFNPPSQPLMYYYEFCGDDAHYSYDCPP
nr:hypothetical protein [Tanacetum cinerariifolium]